jgi:hypothetical protein
MFSLQKKTDRCVGLRLSMPQKKKPFVAGLIPPQWLGDGTGRSAAISSLWCGESVACSVCREEFSFVFRCLG